MAEPKPIEKASGALNIIEVGQARGEDFFRVEVGGAKYSVFKQSAEPDLLDITKGLNGQYVDVEYTVTQKGQFTYRNIMSISKGEQPDGFIKPAKTASTANGQEKVPQEVWKHKDAVDAWLGCLRSAVQLIGPIGGYSEIERVYETTDRMFDHLYKKVGSYPINSQPIEIPKPKPQITKPEIEEAEDDFLDDEPKALDWHDVGELARQKGITTKKGIVELVGAESFEWIQKNMTPAAVIEQLESLPGKP